VGADILVLFFFFIFFLIRRELIDSLWGDNVWSSRALLFDVRIPWRLVCCFFVR
jgi:hypothetical protein